MSKPEDTDAGQALIFKRGFIDAELKKARVERDMARERATNFALAAERAEEVHANLHSRVLDLQNAYFKLFKVHMPATKEKL